MQLQLDIPEDINKKLKLKKINDDKKNIAEVVRDILALYFKAH